MEHEPLLQEVAGKEPQLTPEQTQHLQELDLNVEMWINGIQAEMDRRAKVDDYYRRTHDYKNYEHP